MNPKDLNGPLDLWKRVALSTIGYKGACKRWGKTVNISPDRLYSRYRDMSPNQLGDHMNGDKASHFADLKMFVKVFRRYTKAERAELIEEANMILEVTSGLVDEPMTLAPQAKKPTKGPKKNQAKKPRKRPSPFRRWQREDGLTTSGKKLWPTQAQRKLLSKNIQLAIATKYGTRERLLEAYNLRAPKEMSLGWLGNIIGLRGESILEVPIEHMAKLLNTTVLNLYTSDFATTPPPAREDHQQLSV